MRSDVSAAELDRLTNEANRWLRKDKLSRPKLRAYLPLFTSTDPTLVWLNKQPGYLLEAYALRDVEIPQEERALIKGHYARAVGGERYPSYPWLRGIIAAYLAATGRESPLTGRQRGAPAQASPQTRHPQRTS